MGASIVDRKKSPFDIEKRDLPIVHHHDFCLAGRELIGQCDGLKPL
jgi:hypothetical protein